MPPPIVAVPLAPELKPRVAPESVTLPPVTFNVPVPEKPMPRESELLQVPLLISNIPLDPAFKPRIPPVVASVPPLMDMLPVPEEPSMRVSAVPDTPVGRSAVPPLSIVAMSDAVGRTLPDQLGASSQNPEVPVHVAAGA